MAGVAIGQPIHGIGYDEMTVIHRGILDILSDGKPHLLTELHACCGPSSLSSVRGHLTRIRERHLRVRGEDIIPMVLNRRIFYRWVRLLPSASKE
jgi:hypothetical protein